MKKQGNNRLNMNKRTGWHWLAGSLVCLLTTWAGAQTIPERVIQRCGAVEYERLLQQRNPNRLRRVMELNQLVEQKLAGDKFARAAADTTVYRIPVVVHVVHSNVSNTVGGASNGNISDAQIISQIQVLNEDYRRKPGTNGYNTSPIGADARVEFYLARTDPSGNPSTGITRTYYAPKATFDVINDGLLLSQISYWPSDQYLNIWVTNLLDDPTNRTNGFIGYTQFPTAGDTLQGLSDVVDARIDGSVLDYRVFGRNTGTVSLPLYLLGRTVTHEIGHWLGLIHPWGDNGGCNEDYVADTPLTSDQTTSPTTCRQTFSTCIAGRQTRDLIENYMMYSPDVCMNMFTVGQVARLRAVLQLSARRAKVIQSAKGPLSETETLTVTLYPNPTTVDPAIDVQLKGSQSFNVDLFDTAGRQLRTLSYSNSSSTQVTLPVVGLAPGLYVVRVKTDTEMVSKRLLVQ